MGKKLIAVMALAMLTASVNAEQSSLPQGVAAQFIVTIKKDVIELRSARNPAIIGIGSVAKVAKACESADYRHVALNVTAAVIAGNGERDHTVNPQEPVYSVSDANSNKAIAISLTVEHGWLFCIDHDSTKKDGTYTAVINMFNEAQVLSEAQAVR
jgi:hypothetical protein